MIPAEDTPAPSTDETEAEFFVDTVFTTEELDALTRSMRRAFRARAPENLDPAIALQKRYFHALMNLSNFLKRSGIGGDVADRMAELAVAINDLRTGIVDPALRPQRFGKGHPPDRTVIWTLRARSIFGLRCLLHSGMSRLEAAAHIAKKYPSIGRLKRNPGDDLAGAVLSWHDRANTGKVDNPAAEGALEIQKEFFEKIAPMWSQSEIRLFGENVLAQAAAKAAAITI